MFNQNNPYEDKPEFNMAVMFLTRIDQRLNERDNARNDGDVLKWYRTDKTIFANIFFKVREAGHEKEEKILNELFEKAKNFLSADRVNNANVNNQITALAITNVEIILDQIDVILNTLMYDYGLIFPKKKYMEIEEVIDEEYK